MKLSDTLVYSNWNVLMSKLNQLAVWTHILGYTPEVGKALGPSPFRTDKHAGSCKMTVKGGTLIFMDFATNDSDKTKLNCIKGYIVLNPHLSWKEAVDQLLAIGDCTHTPSAFKIKTKEKELIIPTVRSWELRDKAFWSKRFVTKAQLTRWEASPVSGFSIGDNESMFCELAYSYKCNDKYKLYFPERKSYRFLGNLGAGDLWHKHVSDTLLVTKSHKDFLGLENIVPELSLTHIQSENAMPPVDKLYEWECTYKKIIIWFDPDQAGKDGAAKLASLLAYTPVEIIDSTPYFKEKDVDKLLVEQGYETAKTIVRQILHL